MALDTWLLRFSLQIRLKRMKCWFRISIKDVLFHCHTSRQDRANPSLFIHGACHVIAVFSRCLRGWYRFNAVFFPCLRGWHCFITIFSRCLREWYRVIAISCRCITGLYRMNAVFSRFLRRWYRVIAVSCWCVRVWHHFITFSCRYLTGWYRANTSWCGQFAVLYLVKVSWYCIGFYIQDGYPFFPDIPGDKWLFHFYRWKWFRKANKKPDNNFSIIFGCCNKKGCFQWKQIIVCLVFNWRIWG